MPLDTSTIASAITGTFLPLVIAWIIGRQASPAFKAVFAFFACVLAALAITILTDKWQTGPTLGANDYGKLILVNFFVVLMTAWRFFARLWQPMGATTQLNNTGPQLGGTQT